MIKELPDGQLTTIRTTELSFQSADYIWHSIRYLKANDARRILEAKDNEQVAVNLRLCVIGIRALLEHVMVENISDQGGFFANLKAFETGGFISRVQREAIEPVLEAGHASMHRGFKATEPQVQALLDVTENVLESIYITGGRVKGLAIPPRPDKA